MDLLSAIAEGDRQALGDMVADVGETLTFLTTSVGDEQLEGVLIEVRHGGERIAEITMLLRPLAAVETAMRLTARALTETAERQP